MEVKGRHEVRMPVARRVTGPQGRIAAGLFAALALCAPGTSAQEEHALQVALIAPIQAFPEDDAVRGLRLSLVYGRNTDVTGADFGLVSHVTSDLVGVQGGAVGLVDGDARGVQASQLLNVVRGRLEGVQMGFVNSAADGRGAQISFVSHARRFRGLQIGIVNFAERLEGVQVGLVNIILKGGVLPVMPFVNWSFRDSRPE